MRETLKLSLTLATICLIIAAILSLVNLITEPKIIAVQEGAELKSLEEVLGQADRFQTVNIGDITYYKGYSKEGKLIGYAFKTEGRGYSGTIKTMVGITPKGEITGIEILSQNETPGLGSRITEVKHGEKRPWFQEQFKGRDAISLKLATGVSGVGDDTVSAITGATISAEAVVNSVKTGSEQMLKLIQSKESQE